MFCECFILHVTTSYLQHMFNVLKRLQKRFRNVLQHKFLQMLYAKTFAKHF